MASFLRATFSGRRNNRKAQAAGFAMEQQRQADLLYKNTAYFRGRMNSKQKDVARVKQNTKAENSFLSGQLGG